MYFIQNEIDISNDNDVNRALKNINISLSSKNIVLLNGVDVNIEIRQKQVTNYVSKVSAIPIVRDKMVELQRTMSDNHNVVLEGRDIGTRVFPNTNYKFFLSATLGIRGKRRFDELLKQGENPSLSQVIDEIERRDIADSTREHSPLKKAVDAIEIDTSSMKIEQHVYVIVSKIN